MLFFRGLHEFFTNKLSGEDVKRIHVVDNPIQAVVKGTLGSMAVASYEGMEVTIEFNNEAQTARAEGDRLIAEGEKEAAVLRGEGEADAARARGQADADKIRRG